MNTRQQPVETMLDERSGETERVVLVQRHLKVVPKVCAACGTQFQGTLLKRYCSRSCAARADYLRHAEERRAGRRARHHQRRRERTAAATTRPSDGQRALVGLLPGSAVAKAIADGTLDELAGRWAAELNANIDAVQRARDQERTDDKGAT